VLCGPVGQKVFAVENVDLNITPIEDQEELPPSFGDLPPGMPLSAPARLN
jgi:hypothetical protein